MTRIFRLIGLVIIAATVLSIIGGIDATSASSVSKGIGYREVGSILFVVAFLVLVFVHLMCWGYKYEIRRSHRTVRVP
jgi:hypothetical protein